MRRQRPRLQPEQSEQFGLELVIAEALARQMDKIEGWIEAAARESSRLKRSPTASGSDLSMAPRRPRPAGDRPGAAAIIG